MLSSNNLRSPASGKVLTVPSQDMVFGVYFTSEKSGEQDKTLTFASFNDALLAIDTNPDQDIQAKVVVRVSSADANAHDENGHPIFRIMWPRPV